MAKAGKIILIVALALAVSSVAIVILKRNKAPSMLFGLRRCTSITVFILVSAAVSILLYGLFNHNFHMAYVASHTSTDLDWPYLLSALWAGNAGAMLLWAWFIALIAVILTLSEQAQQDVATCNFCVIMLIEAFVLLLLVFTSSPFKVLTPAPGKGTGLNPLLKHPAMLFHPPLLLSSYAALSFPMALAISGPLTGEMGSQWLLSLRNWTLVAWLLLGAGNLAGAWWAYSVLGWGGYWGWDPVENAGLMPWLVATALLHSGNLYRRTGRFKLWTVTLTILAFLLATLGAFLTRSGIVYSVHAFTESNQGPFFLGFMVAVTSASSVLIYLRRHKLEGTKVRFPLLSNKSLLLATSLLLFAITFVVLEGTIFPAISELIRGTRLHLGASFFSHVTGPLFLLIILLMGVCAFSLRRSLKHMFKYRMPPILATLAFGLILYFVFGTRGYALLGFLISTFAILTIAYSLLSEIRDSSTEGGRVMSFLRSLWAKRARYAANICHIAIAFIALGVIGSSLCQVERQAVLSPGESVSIGGYEITYEGTHSTSTPAKSVITARISVYKGSELAATLTPQVSLQQDSGKLFAEPAIHTTPLEDLYAVFSKVEKGDKAFLKVFVKPLVSWIWIGGGLLLVAGFVCFTKRIPYGKGMGYRDREPQQAIQ